MKISKKDIQNLKSLADGVDPDFAPVVGSRATTYLAIESMNQIRNTMRNNIIFIILGALLGATPSIIESMKEEPNLEKEILQLHKQLHDIKLQINHFQKNGSKKDSL